jgi:serine/threonine protein phosphatase PrpC
MLRVAEQFAGTDTGRQRRANEDSLLARSPLFVVADGMGGAQAGEVASKIAVEYFQRGLPDASEPEVALAAVAHAANSRIHELSHSHAEQAGMGTTLTAVYVGEEQVTIAHVGDSRAYRLRDGELLRLTDDHSLVDELIRQGRLTPKEAVEHPQRSVITRALGPEGAVEVDTRSYPALPGDIYLLCSDGLTTMVPEAELAGVLLAHPRLRAAGEALIAAANEAGGRDNITVVLLRLEEVNLGTRPGSEQAEPAGPPTLVEPPPLEEPPASSAAAAASARPGPRRARHPPRRPRAPAADRQPSDPSTNARRGRRLRRAGTLAIVLVVLGLLGSGAYLASQSVYFLGTNSRGLVTLFRGVPYQLPGGVPLYSSDYVSGVSASTLAPRRRHNLLDHSLRSQGDATALLRSLELGQLE